uniref:Uncharacterized protein n=1 Tax=viral metagenome TaxID=1070528 RepID=A0A6C0LUT2_9ZZZZ
MECQGILYNGEKCKKIGQFYGNSDTILCNSHANFKKFIRERVHRSTNLPIEHLLEEGYLEKELQNISEEIHFRYVETVILHEGKTDYGHHKWMLLLHNKHNYISHILCIQNRFGVEKTKNIIQYEQFKKKEYFTSYSHNQKRYEDKKREDKEEKNRKMRNYKPY